ncbi:MAG: hypothetical protein KKA64_04590 [Nanoarchaeota archaeon]|nr:hypothetical protein [Nanoarchaeota archaeon]
MSLSGLLNQRKKKTTTIIKGKTSSSSSSNNTPTSNNGGHNGKGLFDYGTRKADNPQLILNLLTGKDYKQQIDSIESSLELIKNPQSYYAVAETLRLRIGEDYDAQCRNCADKSYGGIKNRIPEKEEIYKLSAYFYWKFCKSEKVDSCVYKDSLRNAVYCLEKAGVILKKGLIRIEEYKDLEYFLEAA